MKTQDLYSDIKEIVCDYKNGMITRSLATQMLLEFLHDIDDAAKNRNISMSDKNRYFVLLLQHLSLLQCSPGTSALRNRLVRANLLLNSRPVLVVIGLDFSGLTLPELTLSKMMLIACNFDESDIRGAKLNEVKFQGCSFRRADLSDADFRHSTFYGCGFENANTRNAKGLVF